MNAAILKVTLLTLLGGATMLAPVARGADTAPTTTPTTSPDQPSGEKFYGTISAVDTKAMTFTIDDQTYAVVGTTQMTKAADDSAATLADAVVGQPARGTYTKSADGKMNVTKVRFGKKTGGKGGGKAGGKKKKDDAAATTQPQAQ